MNRWTPRTDELRQAAYHALIAEGVAVLMLMLTIALAVHLAVKP
jgi:hypothetical protein